MTSLQALIAKMDEIEAKGINEAGDPAEYARAQQQMDRLEKAARYTGDDPIVRSRAGLPPKLPPIAQWDGKMPQPTGKPDWLSRLTTLGGATKDQAQAVAVNQADNATNAEHKARIAKAKDLITKIKAAISAPAAAPATAESLIFKSNIARQLSESFGLPLAEGVEEAKPLMAELGKIVQGFGSTEDEEMLGIAQQYSELQTAMNKPAGGTTPAPGQTATPSSPSTQDAANASTAEGLQKKIARLKELLEKLKAKKSGAGGAPAAAGGAPAAGGANPLAADPISQNAKPKTENMSEAEKYAQLRDKLLMIERQDQQVDEILGLARGAMNFGKNFIGGLGGKAVQGTARSADELAAAQAATNAKRVADGKKALSPAQLAQQQKAGIGVVNPATKAATVANRTGQVIRNNPGKAVVGATAAGLATGYALGDKPGEAPTPEPKPNPGPGPAPGPKPNPGPAPAPAPEPSPQEPGDDPDMQEIGQLMSDIGQYTNPQDNPDASSVELATKALADAQAQLKTLGITK